MTWCRASPSLRGGFLARVGSWVWSRDNGIPKFAKGQFVIVEDAELEALERHDDSRSIDIERFVPLGAVDPIWMDRTYFLVPGAAPAQRRPYKLLLEAMQESGMGAIGRFVLPTAGSSAGRVRWLK